MEVSQEGGWGAQIGIQRRNGVTQGRFGTGGHSWNEDEFIRHGGTRQNAVCNGDYTAYHGGAANNSR